VTKEGRKGFGFACSRLVPVVGKSASLTRSDEKRVGKLYSWTCGWQALRRSCCSSVPLMRTVTLTRYSGVEVGEW